MGQLACSNIIWKWEQLSLGQLHRTWIFFSLIINSTCVVQLFQLVILYLLIFSFAIIGVMANARFSTVHKYQLKSLAGEMKFSSLFLTAVNNRTPRFLPAGISDEACNWCFSHREVRLLTVNDPCTSTSTNFLLPGTKYTDENNNSVIWFRRFLTFFKAIKQAHQTCEHWIFQF